MPRGPAPLTLHHQRGFGVWGLLFALGPWVVLGYVLVHVMPIYSDHQSVQRAAERAAMAGPAQSDVRSTFDKALSVNRVSGISGQDLRISHAPDGKTVVWYTYQREVPLFRALNLLLKFDGSASS